MSLKKDKGRYFTPIILLLSTMYCNAQVRELGPCPYSTHQVSMETGNDIPRPYDMPVERGAFSAPREDLWVSDQPALL
jgi:hypothetical protein